jgi:hypothetical protein
MLAAGLQFGGPERLIFQSYCLPSTSPNVSTCRRHHYCYRSLLPRIVECWISKRYRFIKTHPAGFKTNQIHQRTQTLNAEMRSAPLPGYAHPCSAPKRSVTIGQLLSGSLSKSFGPVSEPIGSGTAGLVISGRLFCVVCGRDFPRPFETARASEPKSRVSERMVVH